jgi:hypothetical protein
MKTNNVTRQLRKAAKRFSLDVTRVEVKGDMVTYEYSRGFGDIRDFTSIEYVVCITAYEKKYSGMLAEKANYDLGKSEADFNKKMKKMIELNKIRKIINE